MKSLQITAIIILIYLQIKGFRQEILQPSCGRRLVRHVSLITNGFDSNEGDWPWHTAIFRLKNSSYKYICGGTLINSDSVLTAAHCVYEDNRLIIAERLSVQLGRHNLKNIGTNIEEFSAYRIIPHPNYSTKYLSNDIAVIRLSTHATYNKYIQPICLPTSNVEISEVTGKFGTVIGWGVTEKDVISDESLRQAVMPVVSSVTCLESNRDLFGAFLSDRNFCAGFRNGTSVCTGDSGGSLAFEENGVYSIRGIVSLSAAREDNRNLCNSYEYVLFTDVAKYLTWLEEVVPELKSLIKENDRCPGPPNSNALDHLCLYRPGTGTFWILKNTNGIFTPVYQQGDPGSGIGGYDLRSWADQAFAFDYNHCGRQDHIALFRPGTGTFWILKNTNGIFTPVYQQGDPGNGIGWYDLKSGADKALAFDYQHTGKLDHIVLYRPGTGTIWILENTNGIFTPVYQQGDPGKGIGGYDLLSPNDMVMAFDFDHSGKQDHLLLYRPGSGIIFILKNTNGSFHPVFQTFVGIGGFDLMSSSDKIFAFDYNSSGKLDHLVLYRPGRESLFILKFQHGQFTAVYSAGDLGSGIGGFDLKSENDLAFAFDYNRSGKLDHIVLYRPGTGTVWILQNRKGSFTSVYQQGSPGIGIGNYDLKSERDRIFALNY